MQLSSILSTFNQQDILGVIGIILGVVFAYLIFKRMRKRPRGLILAVIFAISIGLGIAEKQLYNVDMMTWLTRAFLIQVLTLGWLISQDHQHNGQN